MHIEPSLAVAGLVVGLLVGLTGMGGGALLTPLLVLFFRVSPLAAISSDLLTSLVMKPVGAAVHMRRRTVHWRLVGWLCAGAVPAGFAGAVLIGTIGHGAGVTGQLKIVIGLALCASVATTVFRQVMDRRARARGADPRRAGRCGRTGDRGGGHAAGRRGAGRAGDPLRRRPALGAQRPFRRGLSRHDEPGHGGDAGRHGRRLVSR